MERKADIDQSDHALALLTKFDSFRKTKKHCDFIISAESNEMHVHKLVVSASSKYFEDILYKDSPEDKAGVLEIKDADPKSVEKCVDFIYTGEASVSEEMQSDLMGVAYKLRLERLYTGIARFLEKTLDASSFYSTREVALRYKIKNLEDACNEFAKRNFRAVARKKGFKDMDFEYLKYLISSADLKVDNTIKAKAVMVWVDYDTKRANKLFELMQLIDFTKVKLSYRVHLAEDEPLISKSNELLKFLMESISENTDTKATDVTLDDVPEFVVLDSVSSKLKCFDCAEKTWSDMQKLADNMKDQSSSVVTDKDYIYVFTADGLTYRLDHIEPEAKWEKMADRKGNWGISVLVDGMIYSTDHENYTNKIERYDTKENKWSFITDKSISALGFAIVGFMGSVTVIGGYQENVSKALTKVQIYHLDDRTWFDGPDLTHGRYNASATVLNKMIHVLGGYSNDTGYVNSAEVFHKHDNSWTVIHLQDFQRQNFSSYVIDQKIYLVGSSDASNFSTIDEYEPVTGEIKTIASLTGMTVIHFSSGVVEQI